MNNRPTVINPRKLKNYIFILFFKSPKALKVPSRYYMEVKVKPARTTCSYFKKLRHLVRKY